MCQYSNVKRAGISSYRGGRGQGSTEIPINAKDDCKNAKFTLLSEKDFTDYSNYEQLDEKLLELLESEAEISDDSETEFTSNKSEDIPGPGKLVRINRGFELTGVELTRVYCNITIVVYCSTIFFLTNHKDLAFFSHRRCHTGY